MRLTEPDETLLRYHVDIFNPATGKAKDVHFKEVDFNLYKPEAKALHLQCRRKDSICGFTVLSNDTTNISNTSVMITESLGKNKTQLVIRVYTFSTGTVFIQGKWFQNFGMVEFPLLLDIIQPDVQLKPDG